MTAPWATKRHAVIIVVLVWLLVCGGLAWASRSAILLEGLETAAAREKAYESARALALSRIDGIVEPVLARERQRPYTFFRSRFKTPEAYDPLSGAALPNGAVLPSPLARRPGPNWLLLHFQLSEKQGWSSPQIAKGELTAPPAFALSPADRARGVTPENWFVALRETLSVAQLLQEFEQALASEIENRPPLQRGRDAGRSSQVGSSTSAPVEGASEYARRAARLTEMEREYFPVLPCEPERVALENLETVDAPTSSAQPRPDCVTVTPNLMMPLWLNLTPGESDSLQLAWVRTVMVETSRYCTIQGVLIDWERLRGELEPAVHDLFPNARIVPVRSFSPEYRQSPHALMQSVPARLDTGPLGAAASPAITSSLRIGLAVAWAATLLALSAISYGTLKYVGMAQRRMQFVAAVTHELRTPLTSFQLYSDLLADMPQEDAQRRREYAHRLQTESKRLARLVENVLAYSRITETGPRVDARRQPVSEILDAAAAATATTCEASGKKLVLGNHCPADCVVETDPEFVIQILANLIENACKYSGGASNPSIWLSAAPAPDGGINFEIEDAGPGVPARDRRTIFEPFRRSDAARTSSAGGVGLGLALSRHWAECLGGRLSLKHGSRNGAAYSCFALNLPAAPQPRNP